MIKADGQDLSYVLVEALDKYGNVHPLADNEIEVTLEKAGRIAGMDAGNPQSFAPLQGTNKMKLFYGKAMIIVQSTKRQGTAKMIAKSEGLKEAQVKIVSAN
jgi:beta-galactosidase